MTVSVPPRLRVSKSRGPMPLASGPAATIPVPDAGAPTPAQWIGREVTDDHGAVATTRAPLAPRAHMRVGLTRRSVLSGMAAVSAAARAGCTGESEGAGITQGPDLRIVTDGWEAATGTYGLMVAPGAKSRSPADLSGSRVAINARDNIVHLIALPLLSVHRVAPENVKFVVVPFPEMGDTLEKGEVDAALMIEPFISQRDFWALQLADVMSGPMEALSIAGHVSTASWVERNPNTTVAFARAKTQAQRVCADPNLVAAPCRTTRRLIIRRDRDARLSHAVGLPDGRPRQRGQTGSYPH